MFLCQAVVAARFTSPEEAEQRGGCSDQCGHRGSRQPTAPKVEDPFADNGAERPAPASTIQLRGADNVRPLVLVRLARDRPARTRDARTKKGRRGTGAPCHDSKADTQRPRCWPLLPCRARCARSRHAVLLLDFFDRDLARRACRADRLFARNKSSRPAPAPETSGAPPYRPGGRAAELGLTRWRAG